MKQFVCLLLILSGVVLGQQAAPRVVERVDISGIPDSRLTPELRADIQKLAGQPYNAETAKQLADGIQIELPEYVAAASTQPGSQPDRIRLMFLVTKIADNDALKTNINSRYVVDAVEVGGGGKFTPKISPELNADLQKMVGKNLDSDQADALRKRIQKENQPPDVTVLRKLRRGDSPNHVKILYTATKDENDVALNGILAGYHSKEGFSMPNVSLSAHHLGVGTFNFRAINNPDTAIERDAGGAVGYSTDYKKLSFMVEYSSYRAQWKPDTLLADRLSVHSPGLYRLRDTASGSVGVNLPGNLAANAGLAFTELQMQPPRLGFQKSNAFTGSLSQTYGKWWEKNDPIGSLNWKYEVHSGMGPLGSDFAYTQHQVSVTYHYFREKKEVFAIRSSFGRVTGNAPMFERFSVGNMKTLRGWSKYELSPLGGNRVANVSVEYTFRFGKTHFGGVTPFFDMGSAWNAGQPMVVHQSVGVRIMPPCKGRATVVPLCYIPITLGIPIRNGNARPAFMAGF